MVLLASLGTLGDSKALQTMERMSHRAIQKGIDPPVQAPSSVRSQATSLLPGGITYVDNTTQGKIEPIHQVQTDVAQLEAKITQTEFRINRGWFVDLFLMLASQERPGTQPLTGREVQHTFGEHTKVIATNYREPDAFVAAMRRGLEERASSPLGPTICDER